MKGDSLGQLIMTGVPGKELEPATARLFRKVQPGAFILFGRNIESASQLWKLIDDLRGLSKIEPIITIDQEGGRVSRLRLIGNEPPNAQQLRDKNDVELIRRHGDITGRLLRVFGFNLDLCRCSTSPSMTTPIILCADAATAKPSTKSFATPAHSTTRCATRGSPVAANIFPVTRPRLSMPITVCPRSIARARNWIEKNSPRSDNLQVGMTLP